MSLAHWSVQLQLEKVPWLTTVARGTEFTKSQVNCWCKHSLGFYIWSGFMHNITTENNMCSTCRWLQMLEQDTKQRWIYHIWEPGKGVRTIIIFYWCTLWRASCYCVCSLSPTHVIKHFLLVKPEDSPVVSQMKTKISRLTKFTCSNTAGQVAFRLKTLWKVWNE